MTNQEIQMDGFYLPMYYAGYIPWDDKWEAFEDKEEYENFIKRNNMERR